MVVPDGKNLPGMRVRSVTLVTTFENLTPLTRADCGGHSAGPEPSHRTSKLTVEPAVTLSPAGGAWETMMLAGDGCGGGAGFVEAA